MTIINLFGVMPLQQQSFLRALSTRPVLVSLVLSDPHEAAPEDAWAYSGKNGLTLLYMQGCLESPAPLRTLLVRSVYVIEATGSSPREHFDRAGHRVREMKAAVSTPGAVPDTEY